jgi:hypothetical protein
MCRRDLAIAREMRKPQPELTSTGSRSILASTYLERGGRAPAPDHEALANESRSLNRWPAKHDCRLSFALRNSWMEMARNFSPSLTQSSSEHYDTWT